MVLPLSAFRPQDSAHETHAVTRQQTLACDATVEGIGFVTGRDVTVRFRPADVGTGLVFLRTDLPDRPRIPANITNVVPRRLRTTIATALGKVEMTEHMLAALVGLGIHNCLIEINASEAPGMDGSALPFVEAILAAGIRAQNALIQPLRLAERTTVSEGDSSVSVHPTSTNGLGITYHLDYGVGSAIGQQHLAVDVTPEFFHKEIAPARTFILQRDVETLQKQGLGGTRISARDLLIFDPAGKPIDNVLRFPDECVRHKILDVIGDFALLGVPLQGHVVADKSGHWLNAAIVRQLACRLAELSAQTKRRSA